MAYNGLVNKTGIFNFGIDFKGGTVVEVDLGQESNIDEVKDLVLGVTGDKNAQVQEVIDSTHVIVKLSAQDLAIEGVAEEAEEDTNELITVASEENVSSEDLIPNDQVIEQVLSKSNTT